MPKVEIALLTADQVSAIKSATSVALFHNPKGTDSKRGIIRIIKETKAPDGWTGNTRLEMEIEVDSYINEWSCSPNPYVSAFCHVGSAQFCGRWRTVCKLLKAGDSIRLFWDADLYGKDSDLVRAGFQQDRLTIQLVQSKAALEFLVESETQAVNAPHRMIQKQKVW